MQAAEPPWDVEAERKETQSSIKVKDEYAALSGLR